MKFTIADLDAALKRDGFTSGDYTLSRDQLPYEGYLLDKRDNWWCVSFCDRGTIRELAKFLNETDGCLYFDQKVREQKRPSRTHLS